jgi:N-acetylglutamate synthase-like GNAT family acetyltransferase
VSGAHDFVALVDGQVAGCGSLIATEGMAVLGGGATLSTHRRRGLQSALLVHRLHLAVTLDCDLAVATALPAGQSARNLERLGFTQLYTQAVLTRP